MRVIEPRGERDLARETASPETRGSSGRSTLSATCRP